VTYAVEFGPEARDQLASIEDHIAAAVDQLEALRMTLVTRNVKEFRRIRGLNVENWLECA
jgi:predicted nucleic acid-binding protein